MIDYVSNLLLNMSAGLLPEHWEPEYRRSRFDRHALKQTSIEHE